MKKRWLILVLLIAALALCACGSQEETEATGATEAIPADALEGNTQIELYADSSCALTLESVGTAANGDYFWKVSMTNKTGSELVFSVDQVYVNEYEADPCWAEKAPASQTVSTEISWFASTFAACGIQRADRVDFTLSVFPSGSKSERLAEQKITVFPNGTEAYQRTEFAADEDDAILADAPEALFAATGCGADGELTYALNVYLENRSDTALEYSIQNEKINGQNCGTYWVHTLDAGKRGFDRIVWDTTEFERMEIFTVSRIEFDLVVTDGNSNAKVLEQHCVVTP